MRFYYFLALLAITAFTPAWGQVDPNCPYWRNPTMFNCSGTPGSASFKGWSARVGQRVSQGASSGTTVYSTCADPNCPDIIGHSNITSSSLNTGTPNDGGMNCCGYQSIWDGNDSRFQIINAAHAGIDEFTINGSNGMQRIPPGYSSCIRLGDPNSGGGTSTSFTWTSGTNKTAEALFYTLEVNTENALLFINYAVVGRCYSHTPAEAGEFMIRVVKQNDDGTWPNAPINDSMWFRISAPAIPQGNPPAPWVMGKPGSSCGSTTCAYVYKPWAKVAISLSRYLYQKVRIEMYNSDCIYSVDPIYAYVCGDYQPMRINSTGCAAPTSPYIDTLRAPEGLTQYTWYAATMGAEEDIYNAGYMDNVHFRQLTQPSDNNVYMPTVADFVLTEGPNAGDTVSTQTFMCTMMSALDPSKPFMSKIYTNLENTKPVPYIGMSTDCSLGVHLEDNSYTFGSNQIDYDSTRWIFYSDSLGTTPIDTMWGRMVDYQFPDDGYYLVSMRTMIQGMSCSAIKTEVCRALQGHEIPIALSDSVLCEDETLTAWVEGGEMYGKEWRLDDSVVFRSDALHPYDTITLTPTAGNHVISLTTTTDGQCPATTTIGVKVIGNSTITSDVDASLICRGDSVTLSALGIDLPRWLSTPYDSSLVGCDGKNVVTVRPQVTTSYTVVPMGDSRCVQNASEITIMVLQYPTPTVYTNRPAVELTNPSLHIEDRSPNSTGSHWTFSDGYTDEGPSIDHYFGTSDDSVWIALHTCNEERCCADTTVWLPVQVNAMWIPNTFTPNCGTNDHFTFVTTLGITYYEIWIYNRQGLLVYHGNDIEQPWDGTDLNGNACPQGAYVYYYIYSCTQDPDRKHPGEGTVLLLR